MATLFYAPVSTVTSIGLAKIRFLQCHLKDKLIQSQTPAPMEKLIGKAKDDMLPELHEWICVTGY